MRDHVAVGVAREASRVLDRDATEDERDTLVERVCVDADADPEVTHGSNASASGSDARSSRPIVASGGVRCSLPHGPRRTWTDDESRRRGREHVIVDPVADVCDLTGGAAREFDTTLEEDGIRLANAEARRRRDDISRKLGVARPPLECGGLVADDPDA